MLPRVTVIRALGALVLLVTVQCEQPLAPPTGILRVTAATTGIDPDPDGYRVSVNGDTGIALAANDTLVVHVVGGEYTLTLSGLAVNCVAIGGTDRSVRVAADSLGEVSFSVHCLRLVGGVNVGVATGGADADPDGYAVWVDGLFRGFVGSSGSLLVQNVAVGNRAVLLEGVAGNCAVTPPNPATVGVEFNATAYVGFVVTCSAGFGSLRVTTATTGSDADPDGYLACIDHGTCSAVPTAGASTFSGLAPGQYTVRLSGMASNCYLVSPSSVTVTVNVGETADVQFTVSCGPWGTVRVTTTTTGVDPDPDGYVLLVDGIASGWVGVNASAIVSRLPVGSRLVGLAGVAGNCTVAPANPVPAAVVARDTIDVAFAVSCRPATGVLAVRIETSGQELDADGYGLWVDQVCDYYGCTYLAYETVAVNDTVVISAPMGAHWAGLADIAGNCRLEGGNPREVDVPPGDTVWVVIAVTCVQLGTLQFTTSMTGVDVDPDGYRVGISGLSWLLRQDTTITVRGLWPGDYGLSVSDVALNCEVTSPNPQVVTVPAGGVAAVTLGIACAPAATLAIVMPFNGVNQVHTLKGNGIGLVRLTSAGANESPAWSAAAGRIAFSSTRDGNTEIYVMNADGTGQTRLTAVTGLDVHPAWSPDGSRIVFVSTRDGASNIYVMNADGSGQTRLTSDPAPDYDPAWSPDGSRIVFASNRDVATGALYLMNPDGSNVARLPSSIGGERLPTWSPDGTRLAAQRGSSDIVLLDATGAQWTGLHTDLRGFTGVSWSPDGRWLAYGVTGCDGYGDCGDYVFAVSVDGTRFTGIMPDAREPAWRR